MRTCFEVVLIVTFLALLIRVYLRTRSDYQEEWQSILDCFIDTSGRTASLSYLIGISEDIACSPSELAHALKGVRPLWMLYLNTRVMLRAIDYIITQPETEIAAIDRLVSIRRDVHMTNRAILGALCKRLLMSSRGSAGEMVTVAARAYFKSFAHLGLTLHDYFPSLVKSFLYSASRT